MRVLVTWSSKHGGTEGIGRMVAEALGQRGIEVVATPASADPDVEGFDGVIVGGAIYANRWAAGARRFVRRHLAQLRRVPVWFFSSGPLDESADRENIPPTTQVAVLAERVGARGDVTFGGRLDPGVKGFPARAMAEKMSGDWRNPSRIRDWAEAVAEELPRATPGTPVEHPERSTTRWLSHGVGGWAALAVILAVLPALTGRTAALAVHALAAPLIFGALARRYFGARGSRDPLPTAATWTTIVALGHVTVAAIPAGTVTAMLASLPAFWLPLALVFFTVWGAGALMTTLPWSDPDERTKEPRHAG